jgi:pimeloyl-ACP methyl ester carboxylesterase
MLISLLGVWLRGLLSLAIIVAATLLLKTWADSLPREALLADPATGQMEVSRLTTFGERIDAWDPKLDRSTLFLIAASLLVLFTFFGRWVNPRLWRRRRIRPKSKFPPNSHRLRTQNGYELDMDIDGPGNAPALILIHGLGSDRSQWWEVMEDLRSRFRIYAFDLLGHGKSDHVSTAEHTLEAAARDLDDVIEFTGKDQVLLAGHSMGGMVALTWCAAHLKDTSQLSGLILVHTTPHNPFHTMAPVPLHTALQKPVHEPILRITPPLAPLVRLMTFFESMSGMLHWHCDLTMFNGSESRDQLDRMARLSAAIDPAAVARFSLSMMRYDVRKELPAFDVPTLVVAADRDGTTIPEASDEIVAGIPQAQRLVLSKTKHMGFMERHSEFAQAVLFFHEETRSAKPNENGEQARWRTGKAVRPSRVRRAS